MVALKSSAIVILTAISAISAVKYVYVDETTTLGYPVHTPTTSSAGSSYVVNPTQSSTSVQSVSSSSLVIGSPTACVPVTVTLPPTTVTVTVTPSATPSQPPKQPEYIINPPKQPEYIVNPPKQPGYVIKPPTKPTPTPSSSSSISVSKPSSTTVSPPPAQSSNPPTQPPSGGNVDEMLCRVNHIRAQNNRKPLYLDSRLMAIAQMQSADQNKLQKMTHEGIQYKGLDDRFRFVKYKFSSGRENIAAGQPNIAEVMKSWLKSEGHKFNMLVASDECFGYANVGKYWSQVYAQGDKCTSTTLPNCDGVKY